MKNYFEIFSAADREMIHSAMLEFLLNETFFRESLFPGVNFPIRPDFRREMVMPGRLRSDLVILDGDNPILYLENKFKSFPTQKQLADYDKHIGKNTAKYLLVFNTAALGDCLEDNRGWKVLTYGDVKAALEEFLGQNQALEQRRRILLEEYAAYLGKYINLYNEVMAAPRLLDDLKKEHDYNMFRRLFLGNIAASQQKRIPGLVVSANSGGATEPLLDLYPPDWNQIPYKESDKPNEKNKWPKIFMQLQGDKIKFYLRWREAGSAKKKDLDPKLVKAILGYVSRLEGLQGIDLKKMESRMASKNASCTICERPFELTDNMEDSVKQVLDFYRQLDAAVKKCGLFPG